MSFNRATFLSPEEKSVRLAIGVACVTAALWIGVAGAEAGAEEEPEQSPEATEAAKISRFAVHGFATLGLVHSNEDQADFLGGLLLKRGAGHSQSWSAEVDSRVGAQVHATFNPRLSAVVQVVAEQGVAGHYNPQLEWVNLKYQLTPDASVRVGRIVLPSFLVSDYRKVGYANAWVRPPVEVYGLIPITTSDGLDAAYRVAFGRFSNTVQAFLGQSDIKLQEGYARARDHWGLSATSERDAMTFRLAYQNARVTVEPFNTLFNAFRQFGPEGVAIADRYDADGSSLPFFGAGFLYDPSDWFVTAEWGTIQSDSAIGDRTAWYAGAGYRFGKLTPYLTYSDSDADSSLSAPGLTVSAYPPALAGVATGLNAALNGLLAANPDQATISGGLRWDFTKDFDLKVQFDHSQRRDGSRGTLGNFQPGLQNRGSYNLVSIAMDFVF